MDEITSQQMFEQFIRKAMYAIYSSRLLMGLNGGMVEDGAKYDCCVIIFITTYWKKVCEGYMWQGCKIFV